MQSHEYRAMLLETIALYLENTPQSLKQANLLRKTGQRSLGITTLNDIIWDGFFSELKDAEHLGMRKFLLELQQDVLGLSGHYFHTYIGNDYTKKFTTEELQAFDYLQNAVNWLNSLKDAQPKDDEHFAEIQRELRSYRSLYPVVDDVYSEKISHFIIKFVSAFVESFNTPTISFAGYSQLIDSEYALVGDRIDVDYPSLARDFAFSQNALLALQGRAWVSFRWQFLPTQIVFMFS